MLLDKKAKTVAYERADLTRKLEYMRGMFNEVAINNRATELYEMNETYNESVELEEDLAIMESFDANGDEDKESEIKMILESCKDLSFDEMIGLESDNYWFEESFMTEGVNIDALLVRNKLRKTCVKELIKAKKAIKNNNKKDAIKYLDNAKASLKECEKEFKKIKFTGELGETAIGIVMKSIINGLIKVATTIASTSILGPHGSVIGIVQGYAIGAETIVDTCNVIIRDLDEQKELTPSSFNTNKNKTEGVFKNIHELIDNLSAEIKGLKTESTTEVSIDDIDDLFTF